MTESAKTIAKRMAEETAGKWQIDVAADEVQLAKALQPRMARWEDGRLLISV